ncbi:CPBP family glutamic-type intramembrane protease [Parabacteroides johnsonii]|jgi:membrane protease YdiL (CAAX protease family)|uniref:CPBP family glutamic-type intramembrane protease n=1 Tax=Parabacteroides johnsonii TaxID=387661 RepID=UPI0018982957|nr:CPBP family glutamic-type intramembrane protease [Parabacteroides johnsonii]
MDKIVKLLLAQLGFVFLGVFLSLPFFVTEKEEEGTDVYWMISGLSLGTLFLAWYIFSKKYVRFNMQTWSLRSLKAVLLTILLSFSFFFLADSLGNWVNWSNERWSNGMSILRKMSHHSFGLVFLLASPIVEELLFRGSILRLLLEKERLAPKYAILASALIYGALNPGENIPYFLFGLLLGYLYYRSGSLSLCILSTMIMNGIPVLLTICYPDVRSVYELMGVLPFIGLVVLSVLLSAGCLYGLNRSFGVPAWQVSRNMDDTSGGILINE